MRLVPALALAVALAACDAGIEEREDVSSTRVIMKNYVAVPPGTAPRGRSSYLAALAPPGPHVTPELLARGRERFVVYCSPCHGRDGWGDGIVTTRGLIAPPAYYLPRLMEVDPAYIVGIITNGYGRMYPYADRIPPLDGWAIAHYVKSLQAHPPPRRPPDVEPPEMGVPPITQPRIDGGAPR